MIQSLKATKWTFDGTMGVMQYSHTTLVNAVNFVDDDGNPANKVPLELLVKASEWAANKNKESNERLNSLT